LHPTASRKPKESLDPWAPSTHDPYRPSTLPYIVASAREEILCSAMREFYVPITIKEWGTIREQEIELAPFTVIASISSERPEIQPLNTPSIA
jgi:hypothetical protein